MFCTQLPRVYLTVSLAALPLFTLWALRRRSQRIAMAKVPSKTVVIIGAAWAGINVAHGLLKQVPNVNVVLINPTGESHIHLNSLIYRTHTNVTPKKRRILF